MRRTLKILSLLLAVALLATGIEIPVSAEEAEEEPDNRVYQTIDGGTHSMWSPDYKLTIVVFGTSSCIYTPPALQYLDAAGFSKEDVALCYIDESRSSLEEVREFADEMATPGITYCYDTTTQALEALRDYSYNMLGNRYIETPTYVFTDNTGKVRKILTGFKDSAEIARAVESIGFEELVPYGERMMSAEFHVTYNQTDARAMLTRINEFRTGDDAWEWNQDNSALIKHTDLQTFTYDYELEKIAMQRAAELIAAYSHTRPNGTSADAAYSDAFANLRVGENIAISNGENCSEEEAFKLWQEEREVYEGQGHRRNMLSKDFKAIGIAHVVYNGWHYWVQEFSSGVVSGEETEAIDRETKAKIDISRSVANYDRTLRIESAAIKMEQGESRELPQVIDDIRTRETYGPAPSLEIPVAAEWSVSSGEDTVLLSDGKLTALKDGKAVIKASYDGLWTNITVTVGQGSPGEEDPVSPGEEVSEELANPYYDMIRDKTTWSYLYMGSYPQSEVKIENTGLREAIDRAVGETITDDCADVWVKYDGIRNKYRKIKVGGKYLYFKWEPIRWKLMQKKTEGEMTTLYLIADKGLDVQYFNKSENSSTGTMSAWEDSTLRTWLNTEFYDMAFGKEAKQALLESTETATAGDRVSILSRMAAGAHKYGFQPANVETRSRAVGWTDYTKKRDEKSGSGALWWLQSSAVVAGDGRFLDMEFLSRYPLVCVPVVRINMDIENAWSFYAKDITIEQTLLEECQEKLTEYAGRLADYEGTAKQELEELFNTIKSEVEAALAKEDREAAETAFAKMEAALEEKTIAKKEEAKWELEQLRENLTADAEFDDSQRAELEAALDEAAIELENAQDVTAVKEALARLQEKIEEIRNMRSELKEEKEKANQQILAWNEAAFLARYGEAEQAKIKEIADKLEADMEGKTEPEEIQELLRLAKEEVATIKTEEQKELEQGQALNQARSDALKELDDLWEKLDEYRIEQQDRIITAIEAAREEIAAAENQDAVKEALEAARQVFDEQPTDAKLKEQEEADKNNSGGAGTDNGTPTPLPAAGLSLNKTNVTLYTGKESNSVVVNPTVTGASKTVTWKTSDPKVATVLNGKITAAGKGTATVTATANGISKTVKVTVKNPVLTIKKGGRKFTKSKLTVKKKKKEVLTVTASPSNSGISIEKLTAKQKKIASVTLKNGKLTVKGKKKGSFTLRIKSGKTIKKIKLTVK